MLRAWFVRITGSATMIVNRRRFFEGVGAGTVVLTLQACGGGDSGSGSGLGFGGGCGASNNAIGNNHGHTLTVPASAFNSAGDLKFSIAGTAGHDHEITLTGSQRDAIKGGASVKVTSTNTTAAPFGAHVHDVTVTCP